jgi:hypothetical protein
MGIALAAFGWTAQQYFDATPHEFFAAYETWQSLLKLQESWAMSRPPL